MVEIRLLLDQQVDKQKQQEFFEEEVKCIASLTESLASQNAEIQKYIISIVKKFEDTQIQRIIQYYFQQQYLDSIELCQLLLKIKHLNEDVLLWKAKIYSKLKDFNNSIETYNQLLMINKYNPTYNYKIGICKNKQANQRAERYLTQSICQDESNSKAYKQLSWLYNRTQRYQKAIKNSDKRLYVYDKDINALLNKGIALYGLSQFREAMEIYEIVIKIDPNHKEIYLFKGAALANLGQYTEAIQMYDMAIKIYPNHKKIYQFKGVALGELGQQLEAIEMFDMAIKIDPNYKEIYLFKGAALEKLGQYTEAIQMYDMAIKIDQNFRQAYRHKGHALQKLGQLEEAIKMYNAAILIDPNHIATYHNKSIALFQLSRYEEANQLQQFCRQLNPNYLEDFAKECLIVQYNYNY